MLTALLGIVSPIVGKILDKIPDAGEREKARLEFELKMAENEMKIFELVSKGNEKQAEINLEEAKSNDKFKSYWRPAIAWVCVSAFAWTYVIQPVATFAAGLFGVAVPELPRFDMGEMMPLLMGLLGLVGARSWDKKNGTA